MMLNRTTNICAAIGVLFVLTAHLWAEEDADAYALPPFERYQPILDRMPFGALPAGFDPNAPTGKNAAEQKAEQEKLSKNVKMSVLNITPDGMTAVGFTDLSVKPPVNYYLLKGAESGGWKIVDANYAEELATLEKDGVTITLKLGQGLVDTPAEGRADAGNGQRGLPNRSLLSDVRKRREMPSADTVRRSYRDNLLARRAKQKAAEESERAEEVKRQEELAAQQEQARLEREARQEQERLEREQELQRIKEAALEAAREAAVAAAQAEVQQQKDAPQEDAHATE